MSLLKSLYGCLIKYTLRHRQQLTFAILEGQLHHIANAIHHPYINPIHQSIHSKLFSKLKIRFSVKPDQLYEKLINDIDKIFWLF